MLGKTLEKPFFPRSVVASPILEKIGFGKTDCRTNRFGKQFVDFFLMRLFVSRKPKLCSQLLVSWNHQAVQPELETPPLSWEQRMQWVIQSLFVWLGSACLGKLFIPMPPFPPPQWHHLPLRSHWIRRIHGIAAGYVFFIMDFLEDLLNDIMIWPLLTNDLYHQRKFLSVLHINRF